MRKPAGERKRLKILSRHTGINQPVHSPEPETALVSGMVRMGSIQERAPGNLMYFCLITGMLIANLNIQTQPLPLLLCPSCLMA